MLPTTILTHEKSYVYSVLIAPYMFLKISSIIIASEFFQGTRTLPTLKIDTEYIMDIVDFKNTVV